jgi:CDP-diacylglycerol--serine O-phosphatidyltransferase
MMSLYVKKSERRRKRIENMKKGIYLLPNILTSMGLLFGFYSIINTLSGKYLKAAWAVIFAAVFDAIDGKIARLTKTNTDFGVEYDSLVDLIAFGVAPGLLVYAWALRPFGKWGWLAAFLYVICAALRLARFNVQINTIENRFFQGLPSPAAAGMMVSVIIFFNHLKIPEDIKHLPVLLLTYAIAFLMVSNVRYNSFKNLELAKKKPFSSLFVVILLLIVVGAEPQLMLFSLFLLYFISGPINLLLLYRRKRIQNVLKERESHT